MSAAFAPDEVLRLLPEDCQPLVEGFLAQARRRRMSVYLVGGPVRDLLLARPIRDVDLIVAPRAEVGAAELARESAPEGAKVSVHSRFGTVSVESGGVSLDIANLRRESYAHAGALPDVEPGSLEEDLGRRDFAVNAMALQLTGVKREAVSEVIDPLGGQVDLAARSLSILHSRSFHDDPTRALRAARLVPRLSFTLARSARSSLRDALRDGAFGGVSGDRLRREIDRLFDDAGLGLNPAEALRRLADWHVLPALEPGLELPRACVAPLRRLGRGLADPPWRGSRVRPGVAGLAVWLAELPPALRRRALARLSVRGEMAKRVAGFPAQRDTLLRQLAKARGRGAVDALLHGLEEEQVFALFAWSPTPIRLRITRWAAEDRGRRLPVSGTELVELGLEGPAVGRVLARIRSAVLDGEVANREEALALARELARRKSRSSRGKARRP